MKYPPEELGLKGVLCPKCTIIHHEEGKGFGDEIEDYRAGLVGFEYCQIHNGIFSDDVDRACHILEHEAKEE